MARNCTLGHYDQAGRLRPVDRTVPLRPDVSRQVASIWPRPALGIPAVRLGVGEPGCSAVRGGARGGRLTAAAPADLRLAARVPGTGFP
ncbi:hypothetical protein AB0F18_33870 [Streptomyces sp. NPDC029216]|uniref:hypothetical protein n=1 Tax=Streptomyces sp. NPDC029216 TaxID=3154701 RepID=UPI0033EA5BF3